MVESDLETGKVDDGIKVVLGKQGIYRGLVAQVHLVEVAQHFASGLRHNRSLKETAIEGKK